MAAIRVTVQVDGLDALLRLDPGEIARRIGGQATLAMAEAVLAAAAPHVPVDTGKLLGSGTANPTSDGGAVVSFDTDYAQDVEHGTPPRGVPLSALQGWADRHGVPAWVVQRAIELRGTRAQPYMAPGLQEAAGSFDGLAADAADTLAAAITGGG